MKTESNAGDIVISNLFNSLVINVHILFIKNYQKKYLPLVLWVKVG